MAWYRTCQECGFVSTRFHEPKAGMSNAYRNATCPECHSEAFDYGSTGDPREPVKDHTQDDE